VSSAAFTDKELEQLRNSVYRGYQMKPRNYGEEAKEYSTWVSDDNSSDPPEFGDQIDFSKYDGSRTSTDRLGKPGHDGDVNTSQLWDRVRKQIGIKDVDSENDLRQMFDYVTAYNKPRETSDPTPAAEKEPETPPTFTPSDDLVDATNTFNQGKSVDSGRPRMNYTDDPYRDAITYGDDTKDYMANSFFPRMGQEASLASKEMKELDKFFLDNFTAKVPKLGDPKELFDYYANRIDNA